ncbi:M50 family metallopeptidase [Rugosimonospora acidiphila]|uniref:M50 family metallopeptidase n=1 Tax=Rugosimonospora acidiphila TaxID=556531 RepID=A0ABP9RR38_9ACTN
MNTLSDLWHRVLSTQPDPPHLLVVVTGIVALLVVVPRQAWTLSRNAVTIAHEGGHALVGVLCGRRLQGIRLHSDTSGLTVSRGKSHGPGMVLSLFAGYVTPSLLGLAGAALLGLGRITLLLWISLVLLLAVLVMIRNVYGALAVLVVGALVFVVSWLASPAAQAAFAFAGTWFLLFGGVRPIRELQRLRRRGEAPDSDADQLARLTRVPGLFWVVLFGLVNLAALVLGGYLLVQPLLRSAG